MESIIATQYIEFAEKGFNTVVGIVQQFKQRLDESNKSAELLKKALDSGTYAKVSQQVAVANAHLEQLNAQARKIDLEARFGKVGAMAILAKESRWHSSTSFARGRRSWPDRRRSVSASSPARSWAS